jgi:hypothetical protein
MSRALLLSIMIVVALSSPSQVSITLAQEDGTADESPADGMLSPSAPDPAEAAVPTFDTQNGPKTADELQTELNEPAGGLRAR